MIKEQEAVRVVSLMLTWACNLNCTYCFELYKRSDREMTVEVAKRVLSEEFATFTDRAECKQGGYLKIDFFGGEPLLRFDLIREVTEWVVGLQLPFRVMLSVTSNGTLLDHAKQQWFEQNKAHIRVVLSVDGTEEIQQINRGELAADAPLSFVRRVWPTLHFKSTISRAALPTLSRDLITLLEAGHTISPNLASGEDWQIGDDVIYKRELEALAAWHLAHPEVEPMRIFMQHFIALVEPHCNQTPKKNCGTGTTMVAYDWDGTPYPCHLFVPITHGRQEAKKELDAIDFFDDARFQDAGCADCPLLRVCKSCYGFNYRDRGDVNRRDRRVCRMMLVEAQVISAFQINYLMRLRRQRELNTFELTALQGAVRCYELFHDFSFDEADK